MYIYIYGHRPLQGLPFLILEGGDANIYIYIYGCFQYLSVLCLFKFKSQKLWMVVVQHSKMMKNGHHGTFEIGAGKLPMGFPWWKTDFAQWLKNARTPAPGFPVKHFFVASDIYIVHWKSLKQFHSTGPHDLSPMNMDTFNIDARMEAADIMPQEVSNGKRWLLNWHVELLHARTHTCKYTVYLCIFTIMDSYMYSAFVYKILYF